MGTMRHLLNWNSPTSHLTCFLSVKREIQPQTVLTQPWLSHPARRGSIFSQGGHLPTKTRQDLGIFKNTINIFQSHRFSWSTTQPDRRGNILGIFPIIAKQCCCWKLSYDLSLTAACTNRDQQGCNCEIRFVHTSVFYLFCVILQWALASEKQTWGHKEAEEPAPCGSN